MPEELPKSENSPDIESEKKEKIKALEEALRILDHSTQSGTIHHNIIYYLGEAGEKDIAEDAIKILIEDAVKKVFERNEGESMTKRHQTVAHWPVQVADRYKEFFEAGIADQEYNKIGMALQDIYSANYESKSKEDDSIFQNAIERFEAQFKDFKPMDEKVKEQLLMDIRKKIESRLVKL